MRPSLTREQLTIILHGVLGLAVLLVLLQLWLLTATVNACKFTMAHSGTVISGFRPKTKASTAAAPKNKALSSKGIAKIAR